MYSVGNISRPMTSSLSYPLPSCLLRSSARMRRTAPWVFAGVLLAGAADLAHAESGEFVEEIPLVEQEVVIAYPSTPELPRHVEVRRALLSEDDLQESRYERRRLSAEERSALHLELRRAVRSAYQDDAFER